MSTEEFKILWTSVQEIQTRVTTMNHEMGGIEAQIEMIKWFIGANVVAWIGVITSAVWQIIIRKK